MTKGIVEGIPVWYVDAFGKSGEGIVLWKMLNVPSSKSSVTHVGPRLFEVTYLVQLAENTTVELPDTSVERKEIT